MNQSMTTFFSHTGNTYAYNITTTDSTLAVSLVDLGSNEVDSNLRVVFMQVVSDGITIESTFLPAVSCQEFFANEPDQAFFSGIFADENWVCPDTT